MSVPVADSVRRAAPDARIVWAVESRCSPVVDRLRLVSAVHEFPRDRWKRTRWSPTTWRDQMIAYTRLRRERFELGVDLQGHSKTALCLRLAKPARRLASRATDALARRLNPLASGDPESMHAVDWNLHVLSMLGEFPREAHWTMPDLACERLALRGRVPKGLLATIATATGTPAKSYPPEGWAEVAKGLTAMGMRVAFLGGPGDPRPQAAGTTDLVDKLKLSETMAAVAMSAIHLAGDTGTGHMAAAYGVPVVSVFGPTRPEQYRPYTSNGIALREGPDPASVKPKAILEAAATLLGSHETALPH
ncbi:MAG: hypothetical protein HY248_04640 [Fimbriimonas ginsengisoli]|uniref:Glycosyltransferase family 9 protein n=1 Tax=Fimbriimonas ginsengisoli TaxID=1005039 RepID=A0A931LU24_FIMGI|nr:hypothetical protein [Fimbriimonas ginsengisoli]MBI3721822.1 hypothetical protein [Fimbriimonas ginsengisoli]